jgi:hypothetical protein
MKNYIILTVIFVILAAGATQYSRDLKWDKMTNTLMTIDYAHHEIHDGDSFVAHFSDTLATDIDDRTIIYFTTGPTKSCHVFAEASSTAASIFTVCELSAIDINEGTDLAVWNRNRASTNTPTTLPNKTTPGAIKATSLTHDQAAAANITITNTIWRKYLGVAAAGADTAGETRENHEFVLNVSTQYAFIVTSTTADTSTHNIIINWYEH